MRTITSDALAQRLGRRQGDLRKSIRVWFRDEPDAPEKKEEPITVGGMKMSHVSYILNQEHCKEILTHIKTDNARTILQSVIDELGVPDSSVPVKIVADKKQPTEGIMCKECPEFGELHYAIDNGRCWYCVSDICRSLRIMVREAEEIISRNNHETREFFFRRKKITMGYSFVDTSGLLSLIIESRKTKANAYRMWVEKEVHPMVPQSPTIQTAETTMVPTVVKQLKSLAPEPWDMEGEHPTIDEYFHRYVPADTFCAVLLQLCLTCLAYSNTMPHQTTDEILAQRDMLNKVYIMRTFHDALRYNFAR